MSLSFNASCLISNGFFTSAYILGELPSRFRHHFPAPLLLHRHLGDLPTAAALHVEGPQRPGAHLLLGPLGRALHGHHASRQLLL